MTEIIKKKIKFIRPTAPLNYAYTEGEIQDIPQALAAEFIAAGFAIEILADAGAKDNFDLPADLPGRDALIAASVNALSDLKKMIADGTSLTEITGIGKATAEKIIVFLS